MKIRFYQMDTDSLLYREKKEINYACGLSYQEQQYVILMIEITRILCQKLNPALKKNGEQQRVACQDCMDSS